jgi:hypothetical protein
MVHSSKQADERGFATTGGPDEGQHFTWSGLKGYAVEHLLVFDVPKADLVKFNPSGNAISAVVAWLLQLIGAFD